MGERVVGREPELGVVRTFLAQASEGPSLLALIGEPGIGKTTLWQACAARATEVGFRVLSTRAQSTGSVATYSGLADLLGVLDESAFDELPRPQRLAIDRVLAPSADGDPAAGQRAVFAAVRGVLDRLAQMSPVLVAIDDLQWLDPPSRLVISSVARRCTGRIGFVATVRADVKGEHALAELELHDPARMHRLDVRPLSLGALRQVLTGRLTRSLARGEMVRIHRESGGNPFYAVELARAADGGAAELPATLGDLVRARIAGLTDATKWVLLAASCLPAPTMAELASVTESELHEVVALLEDAERAGVIEISGQHLRFTHPLLARGAYAEAAPDMRRLMHRRLAHVLDDAELGARHLALSVEGADEHVLRALDAAAESARMRGAPATAAELLELARGRGGDTPERTITAAAHHFEAGGAARARTLLQQTVDRLTPGPLRAEALHLLGLVRLYDNSSADAAALLRDAVEQPGAVPDRQVPMLVMLAFVEYNAGDAGAALSRAEQAVALADQLPREDLVVQATTMRAMMRFLVGDGVDEVALNRALQVDDPADVPLAVRPRTLHALVKLWAHQVDEAAAMLTSIAQRCVERGEESELILIGFNLVLAHTWRGDMDAAERAAEATMERALALGGDLPMFIALTVRALVDAQLGRVEACRRNGEQALLIGRRCDSGRLSTWAATALGSLELSLGNHEAALRHLAPLVAEWRLLPAATEIVTAPFLPDAVEAMIVVGRLDDADRIVEVLERNGERLGRPWTRGVAARCRSLLHAARGDLEAAAVAADRALREHGRASMPFELARTQLLAGHLQHRLRQREAAADLLQSAMRTFERMGLRFWAERARWEVTQLAPRQRPGLTAPELRAAELAAAGRTNKEIAAELFVSTKTIELHLSRVYRKLGIRSRAGLWRALRDAD